VITIDEATNKRLLRIIDWHLMPLMCIVYGLNYLDSRCCLLLSYTKVLSDLGQRLRYPMLISWD
jgi:ACS family allantoate permease-like MFS transporter